MTQFNTRVDPSLENDTSRASSLGDFVRALGFGSLAKVFIGSDDLVDIVEVGVSKEQNDLNTGERSAQSRKVRLEVDCPNTVRVESAGIFGLTSCSFDAETGELLSTTRPREATLNPVSMLGIPGEIIDREVDCPRRDKYKCQSCPNRTSPPETLEEPKTAMDPEQLANAQQLHGTIHGFS